MNYRTHIVSTLSDIGQPAWDGLAATQDKANPFLSFYLTAQEAGELVFEWVDDSGVRGSERAVVALAG